MAQTLLQSPPTASRWVGSLL